MDPDRAGQLLAREREQIEQAIAELDQEGPEELAEQHEPGDGGSEDLYQKEFDAGLAGISLPSSRRWSARRHGSRREPSASPPRAASRFPTSASRLCRRPSSPSRSNNPRARLIRSRLSL